MKRTAPVISSANLESDDKCFSLEHTVLAAPEHEIMEVNKDLEALYTYSTKHHHNFIIGSVEQKAVFMLVDTGSDRSFVDSDFAAKHEWVIETVPPVRFNTVSNHQAVVNRRCLVQFHVKSHKFKHSFLITKLQNMHFLLGLDFLGPHRAVIFMRPPAVRLAKDLFVPLIANELIPQIAYTACATPLAPRASTLIRLTTLEQPVRADIALFEPHETLRAMLPPSLVSSVGAQFSVLCTNFDEQPQLLPAGLAVGTVQPHGQRADTLVLEKPFAPSKVMQSSASASESPSAVEVLIRPPDLVCSSAEIVDPVLEHSSELRLGDAYSALASANLSLGVSPSSEHSNGEPKPSIVFGTERCTELRELVQTASVKSIEVKNGLCRLLKRYKCIFSPPSPLGHLRSVTHKIELLDESKVHAEPPRRQGPQGREKIRQHLAEMKELGVIRPSHSPYASGVVLVPKKDGEVRFCVDYRRLNENTVANAYPLPRIDDLLNAVREARVFSKFDLKKGYWQAEVANEDIYKTAFTTHEGLYEFLRMPFGLRNAPATFQSAMNRILASHLWNCCLVYIDDVLIFSRTEVEHLEHLERVFHAFKQAGPVTMKPSKCRLFQKELSFLGHIVSQKGIAPMNDRVEAIVDMPAPAEVSQLRTFLGMVSYYRAFIPGCSSVAAPLHRLTGKKVPFIWGP